MIAPRLPDLNSTENEFHIVKNELKRQAIRKHHSLIIQRISRKDYRQYFCGVYRTDNKEYA